MFEITYATSRLARIVAPDREAAKRRFAAYVHYDDTTYVESDIEVSFGEAAELAPYTGPPPTAGKREELRAWLAHRDAESERFEPAFFEDPERSIDAYLRLLATNDPWRLEGHGSLGRVLSAVPVAATLTTFDARIAYRFEATQFVDYLRDDIALTLDPNDLAQSVRVANLVDVAALHNDELRQIGASYEGIARELALTARFASVKVPSAPYAVTFDRATWSAYVAHRRAEPERFAPPADWTPAFPGYGDL